MATKHWHLTTDPDKRSDQGGPIKTRKMAEQMAKVYRQPRRPIYVITCSTEHGR